VLEPALQRSFTGTGIVALFLQKNANQSATPRGVPLSHLDGFVELVTVRGQCFGGTATIIGFKSTLPTHSKTMHQIPHRPHRKLELFSEAGYGLAFLPTLQDHLPNRNWNSSWHRSSSMNRVKSNATLL
jgi:hypothetical protein